VDESFKILIIRPVEFYKSQVLPCSLYAMTFCF
jgi:hypothetical protein